MKINTNFIMNKVGSRYVVVPVGDTKNEHHRVIRLNETGAFLWNELKKDLDVNDLIASLTSEYDVDINQATEDVFSFIEILRKENILDE